MPQAFHDQIQLLGYVPAAEPGPAPPATAAAAAAAAAEASLSAGDMAPRLVSPHSGRAYRFLRLINRCKARNYIALAAPEQAPGGRSCHQQHYHVTGRVAIKVSWLEDVWRWWWFGWPARGRKSPLRSLFGRNPPPPTPFHSLHLLHTDDRQVIEQSWLEAMAHMEDPPLGELPALLTLAGEQSAGALSSSSQVCLFSVLGSLDWGDCLISWVDWLVGLVGWVG